MRKGDLTPQGGGMGVHPSALPALDIRVWDAADGRVAIAVSGELDLSSSVLLHDVVRDVEGAKHVDLDLTEVTFMDSTGLRALWTIRQELASGGATLRIASASDAVRRVLRITKLEKVFDQAPPDSG